MKLIPVLAATILVLAGCGNSSTGGNPAGPGNAGAGSGDNGKSSGDGLPMPASPPDLAALPGGRDHLVPLAGRPPLPDACKVLTPAMVLALIPGAGKDGTVTTPRSTPGSDGTPVTCQYLATAHGSDGVGNIIVNFQLAGHPDQFGSNETSYKQDLATWHGKPLFKDYGGTLGTHSLAFYNPGSYEIDVLYNGQPFHVSAAGATIGGNQGRWRDDADVAIARNIVARMNR
jgi:hypothetical protein